MQKKKVLRVMACDVSISVNGEQSSVMTSDKQILPPRTAARFIAEHSHDVKVAQDGVEKTARKVCNSFIYL